MKKILSVLLSLSLFTLPQAFAEGDLQYYVSPAGMDTNPGTFDRPFKTLDRARTAVAGRDATVYLREGEYRFSDSTTFGASDSAPNQATYIAYNGERVVFKGSIEIDATKGTQVTDDAIRSRMYESVRDKVVCFDLSAMGFDASMVRQEGLNDGPHSLANGEVNGVYIDGRAQTVAMWPNGEAEYVRWDTALDGHTIMYSDVNPSRWANAKNYWIGGYPSYDYYYIRQSVTGLDTDNKTISATGSITMHCFTSSQSRRWKAINLLEELDIPGEYYIDAEALKLYMYPSASLNNARVEVSWLNNPLLMLNGASNIRFEGITFTQTRGDAVDMVNVNNIDFVNCSFDDILYHAVYCRGTANAQTDKNYWQVQDIDGSYNCDITGCSFTDIGGGAIHMSGGNVDTLRPSNNVISNNFIYHANYLAKNQNTILLKGCGTSVLNNNISKCPFQAIRFYGNDHVIKYNEIYNVDQETDDCGAIYCGRNTLQRGTEIAYNFLHDLQNTEKLPFGFQGGLYWDDRQGGMNAHHNIIKNARIDIASNGSSDFTFANNTSVDMTYYTWRFLDGGLTVNDNAGDEACGYRFNGYIANPELYYEKYPTLRETTQNYASNDPQLAKYNILKNNLSVNPAAYGVGENTQKYGALRNNVQLAECNDFVDPAHQDYRIKSNSETARAVPGILTDEFDLDQIGLTTDVELNSQTSPFNQVYPYNGERAVPNYGLEFVWEAARGATSYRLTIATDPDLKNIVYNEVVPYTTQKVDTLLDNAVYYWKVTALNTSHELFSEWDSNSCVYSFSTAMYSTADTTLLDEEIASVNAQLDAITEGEGVGEYPIGTKDSIRSTISIANALKKSKTSGQRFVDGITRVLASSFNHIGMVNRGFIPLKNVNQDGKLTWRGSVNSDGDTISVVSSASGFKYAGCDALAYTTGSCIYSFDAKVNTSDYMMLGLCKYDDMPPYSAANTGYSLCIKSDIVELQLSTGTGHSVLCDTQKTFANDGKYHSIDFGFVTTELGNMVALYVDGEQWLVYPDIIGTSVKNTCQIMVFLRGVDGDDISIKPVSQVGDATKLTTFLNDAYHASVPLVVDAFDASTKVNLFCDGSNAILTPDGVVYADAPCVMQGNDIYASESVLATIYGINPSTITNRITREGNTLLSVAEVLSSINHSATMVSQNGIMVDGNIIFMNNVEALNKAKLLAIELNK